MEQTFTQTLDGYYREINKGSLPKKSGVYFVYECTHNEKEGNVSIHKLIYIGESADINDRIANHEKLKDWQKHVKAGNTLCYGYTFVDTANRERVEAAYIYYHKPPVNTEYKDNFPFDKTIVKSDGKTAKIEGYFVANKKVNA